MRGLQKLSVLLSISKIMLAMLGITIFANTGLAATIQVGPSRTYTTPSAAAAVAHDGDIIEIDAGLYQNDVATWEASNLTLRGVGGLAHLDVTGMTIPNGKAIWVIQGNNTTVEQIEFSGADVPDNNGAGIRMEGYNLNVRSCYFHNNENGILESNRPNSTILVEYSVFAYQGYGTNHGSNLTHNIYIGSGSNKTFFLRFCYSHHAKRGHLVKSRAGENHILYNRLSDESDGTSSYVLDLPDGGRSYVMGNILHKGTLAENTRLLTFAEESTDNTYQELYVSGNTFVNDRNNGIGIRVSGTPTVRIVNNLFDNCATMLEGSYTGTVTNNIAGTNLGFVNRANYDYHLTASSPAINAGVNPGSVNGVSLTPTHEYVHPAKSKTRTTVGAIDVGAYEYGSASVSYILWTN